MAGAGAVLAPRVLPLVFWTALTLVILAPLVAIWRTLGDGDVVTRRFQRRAMFMRNGCAR